MSLLIKALATAEKEKQAELKKVRESSAQKGAAEKEPLTLTLEEPDTAHDPAPENVAEALIPEATEGGIALEDDAHLSLEEEAGFLVSKQAKARSVSAKAKESKSVPRLSDGAEADIQKNKSEAFEAAAKASVANLKSKPVLPSDNEQKMAASVFVANQAVKNSSSQTALILLGIAGALIIWLGMQGYQYIQRLNVPDVVVIKPAPAVSAENVSVDTAESTLLPEAPLVSEEASPSTVGNVEAFGGRVNDAASDNGGIVASTSQDKLNVATESASAAKNTSAQQMRAAKQSSDITGVETERIVAEKVESQPLTATTQAGKTREPLRVVSKIPAAGVDPTLLSAYQAFSRGEDAVAQQQYRQVLQRDVRNIDALLGMAAIAQRQGRNADAMGWYQKVLEVEPRNVIAQSAVANLNLSDDAVSQESRIKNMLANQPESANLHAALGNVYAAQDQWASAQESYFNASRFAPNSADFAFNLAVSLDHLGKSSLALAQYRRALDLLNTSGASTPDRVQLEARIQALQVN